MAYFLKFIAVMYILVLLGGTYAGLKILIFGSDNSLNNCPKLIFVAYIIIIVPY